MHSTSVNCSLNILTKKKRKHRDRKVTLRMGVGGGDGAY